MVGTMLVHVVLVAVIAPPRRRRERLVIAVADSLAQARPEQEASLSREPNPTRCRGCGGWITLHRLDTTGCTTCQILAARS